MFDTHKKVKAYICLYITMLFVIRLIKYTKYIFKRPQELDDIVVIFIEL